MDLTAAVQIRKNTTKSVAVNQNSAHAEAEIKSLAYKYKYVSESRRFTSACSFLLPLPRSHSNDH